MATFKGLLFNKHYLKKRTIVSSQAALHEGQIMDNSQYKHNRGKQAIVPTIELSAVSI